jgi:hypothetical protein
MPPSRRLDWTREEIILAMDLYVRSGGLGGGYHLPGPKAPEIIQLSQLLRALSAYPSEMWPEKYRNEEGVALKLQNLRSVETSGQHGMPAASRMDATVWRDFIDDLGTLHAEASAIRGRVQDGTMHPAETSTSMQDVPVEEQHTETFVVNPDATSRQAFREEQKLVLRYRDYMKTKGIDVRRKKYVSSGEVRPIFSDVWVEARNALVEAKSSDDRGAIRQAIGQLYDYRRFHKPVPPKLAVLLPHQPTPDRMDLLKRAGIHAIWPHGAGFRDSAHGEFV